MSEACKTITITLRHLLYSPDATRKRFHPVEVWFSKSGFKKDDTKSVGFILAECDEKDYSTTKKERELLDVLNKDGRFYTTSVVSTSICSRLKTFEDTVIVPAFVKPG